jgi:hemerythrin-like domain-containing protein
MDAIDLLEDQHRDVLDLIPRVISAPRDSRRELFDRMADLLAIHATIEELHFYPAVRAAAGEDEEHFLYRSLEEHLQAKRLVADLLGTAVSDPTFEAKLEVLRDELEHHIEEERDELFAVARRVLDEEQREGLGQEMTATLVQLQKGRPRLDVPLQTRVASPLTPPPPAQGALGSIIFPRFARLFTIPLQLGARVSRFVRFLAELRPPPPRRAEAR